MIVRRSAPVLALLAAALVLPASHALAQAPARPQMRGAALLGFEDADGPAGLALRVDGELVQRPLSPAVGFSIVGSLGYSRWSDDGGVLNPLNPLDDTRWESSLGILKFVPAARFTFGNNPRVRPYADAGLGLYYASATWEGTQIVFDPVLLRTVAVPFERDDSEVGIVLRFATGIAFEVSPGFSLGAELGLNPYLGDVGDETSVSLLFGAQMRL